MESDVSPEKEAEFRAAFRHAIASRVLLNRRELDARTATVLQKEGIFENLDSPKLSEDLPAILGNPEHMRRADMGIGPLLFVTEGPKQRAVIDVKDLLLSTLPDVRSAALEFFLDMVRKQSDFVTPKTQSALKRAELQLAADDGVLWREAGLGLRDAVEEDWLCNLEGARQSFRAEFDEGIAVHLTRVMRPTVSSLDSIAMVICGPADEPKRLQEQLGSIVKDSKDFGAALGVFYESLGYLPLSLASSLPKVLRAWEAEHGQVRNIWECLWEWADRIDSPLPRYYVCQCFIDQPSRIPEGRHGDFWHEIAEIADYRQNEKSLNGWSEAWKAVCELARHFCMHLEFQSQGQYGEGIAAFSWWLARRTTGLFSTAYENIGLAREITIQSELAISSEIRLLSRPMVTPSALRCVTLNLASPWSRAILCEMGPSLAVLRPEAMAAGDRDRLSGIIEGLPAILPSSERELPGGHVYGFENPSSESVRAWMEHGGNDPRKEVVLALLPAIEKLNTPEGLAEAVRESPDDNVASQDLVMHALRVFAFMGTAPAKELWEILSNEKTRRNFFKKLSLDAINAAIDALIEVAGQRGEKWTTHLQHFFAMECEAAVGDQSRRELLFAGVILASACFDSVSAIDRLLKGQHKHAFKVEADYWRKRYEDVWTLVPAWVQARFRAMLSALPSLPAETCAQPS